MSEYVRSTYGPGDIAALPPTIGAGDGGPTIGAEDVGHRIKQAFPFTPHYAPGAVPVEAAGVQLPMNGLGRPQYHYAYGSGPRRAAGLRGLGTNGNGNGAGLPGWAIPVGIGLVLGGLYMYFKKDREPAGFMANEDEPACNGCGG